MIKKVTYLLLTFMCFTCVFLTSSEAQVIEGPLLIQIARGWYEPGLIIRAESDVVLVSVRYPNMGLADNIELRLHSDGTLLSSVPVPAGDTNATVEINYPLTAGELYELVSTTPNNSMWTEFSGFPVSNPDITVLSSCGFGFPLFRYWFVFNEIVTETIEPVLLKISIDIKPGSYPNSINLKSRGVVPVAILSTEDFYANSIVPESIVFAGAYPLRWIIRDVDDDGDDDILLHFETQQLVNLDKNSTEAILTGETFDGVPVEGKDTVNIVPKKK